jgi:hypothetical protein
MNHLTKLIDRYVLFARIAPVAIVASALFLLISSWIPFSEWPIKLIAGSGMLVLGAFALAHLARTAGQAIQAPLWASWGGPPTVRMLRHRDPTFKPGSKMLIHQRLIALGIVDHLPSVEEEQRDPAAADEHYLTCAEWLRRKALELKSQPPFDIVHSENIAYGFQRNSLGIKNWGLTVIGVSLAGTAAAFVSGRQPWIELAAELMLGAYVIWGVTEAAMKRAANDYSMRLLDAVQAVPANKTPVARRKPTTGHDAKRKAAE